MEKNQNQAAEKPTPGDPWPSVEEQRRHWEIKDSDADFLRSLALGLEQILVGTMPYSVKRLRAIADRLSPLETN